MEASGSIVAFGIVLLVPLPFLHQSPHQVAELVEIPPPRVQGELHLLPGASHALQQQLFPGYCWGKEVCRLYGAHSLWQGWLQSELGQTAELEVSSMGFPTSRQPSHPGPSSMVKTATFFSGDGSPGTAWEVVVMTAISAPLLGGGSPPSMFEGPSCSWALHFTLPWVADHHPYGTSIHSPLGWPRMGSSWDAGRGVGLGGGGNSGRVVAAGMHPPCHPPLPATPSHFGTPPVTLTWGSLSLWGG